MGVILYSLPKLPAAPATNPTSYCSPIYSLTVRLFILSRSLGDSLLFWCIWPGLWPLCVPVGPKITAVPLFTPHLTRHLPLVAKSAVPLLNPTTNQLRHVTFNIRHHPPEIKPQGFYASIESQGFV